MITKKALEQLRVSQPKPNCALHYTIGGSIEKHVHATVEAERLSKLNHGDKRMQQELKKFRHEVQFSSREGQAKAQFNNTNQPQIKKVQSPQP